MNHIMTCILVYLGETAQMVHKFHQQEKKKNTPRQIKIKTDGERNRVGRYVIQI